MRREFRAHLRETVLAHQYRSIYEQARLRVPALAAHASIATVLAVLAGTSDELYAERDELALALIREQQRAPSALWTSALLIAFTPMLLRLRGRISGNVVQRDDLDLLVVEVFLEVVQCYPVSRSAGRTALYLRQDSQRAVFRALNLEQARSDANTEFVVDAMDLCVLGDLVASEIAPEAEEEDRQEMRMLLRERAAFHVPVERLEILEATYVWRESLGELVARRHPELDARARHSVYERLKRERQRTVAKLRPLFFTADADDDERSELPASSRQRVASGASCLASWGA